MDSVKVCVILFATGCVLPMCMALNCKWKTQYEYKGRCCQICPSGEFPRQHCTENNQTVCEKCENKHNHCFCNNNLCENDDCSRCVTSPRCRRGEELRRLGSFEFDYICKPCLNQTYNDEEDKMCKPMLDCRKCGFRVIFPGNSTHNAICAPQETATESGVTTGPSSVTVGKRQVSYHDGPVVCLAITNLVSLAMLIYFCIQRTRVQKTKKKYPPTSSSLKFPSDECVCKLSKEEIGEVHP
ncbi:tumor necrosis factor receptor superfamily member 18 [Neoarius graeffei]|uniref:tumor necrosis factor receptor superfamily member 18 n=1 Tax=Neoarius graeffei TaxID=443677 RepID=UPI00298C9C91|nr:tumor necrosis factor receptor superfamily member 18 [Neoarius graeffei]